MISFSQALVVTLLAEQRARRASACGKQKKWAALNRGKVSARFKAWRVKNREARAEYQRQYTLDNRQKISAQRRARKNTDSNFRLRSVLSSRLSLVLKRNSLSKTPGLFTMDLLGCSLPELRQHLQAQFADGMTWENHGKRGWHVDHKKPCALFDLTQPDQQRQCFHFTNLQPLWAFDNISKGKKYAATQ